MPENRFFLEKPFSKGLTASLESEEFRHLKVMRKNVGDTIELVNGQSQLATCKILNLQKNAATLTLLEIIEEPAPKPLILAQALLRPSNLDLVIEKGTELGATEFWLFPTQNSEKTSLTPNQSARLRHLTISALKQCGRLDLPPIHVKPPLAKWESFPFGAVFGDLEASKPLRAPSMILIGPEKGFSPQEIALLREKAEGIRLHPNTLRAETAALCALSQVFK